MLNVQDLHKRFGTRAALDGIGFDIAAGQFVALLGPNGAGKSTLFQLLTGLFTPSRGTIRIDGIDLRARASAALARIGVVFQPLSLDLELSARRNLALHAALHGLPRRLAQQRIDEDAARAGLGAELDRPVRALSGGLRRRVELVRALLHRPALLLMDEATVGLDPASRRALLATLHEDVRQRGSSVLWATHWVEEALPADRVLVLHHGRLLADGRPDAVAAALGGGRLEDVFVRATGDGEGDGR
ncbi:ATP-binding cassette domain-containing protein [Aquabacterium humicola]|uniref:ATP-binding cassette domain-containing protein n=1 Tax=Aquabacterium humicola TaxID=3237377 RepID=UPI0025429D46|nr:ATP-binding cassette domain-containing protein [Rubrivivax pictus]